MAYVSTDLVTLEVQVHVDVTEEFTTALVFGNVAGVVDQAVGTAKKHPHDKSNPQVGSDLAIARAFIELGLSLEAQALKEAGA